MSPSPPDKESVQAFVAPHGINTLVVPEVFVIDLYIDPADPRTRDDVYRLLNEDGSEHQRRVAADDAILGDDKLTLVFTGLHRGLEYSLLIDEGAEGTHYVFHQVLLDDLLAADAAPDASVDGPGDQSEPEEHGALEWEEGLPEAPAESHESHSSGWVIADRAPTEGVDDPIV